MSNRMRKLLSLMIVGLLVVLAGTALAVSSPNPQAEPPARLEACTSARS